MGSNRLRERGEDLGSDVAMRRRITNAQSAIELFAFKELVLDDGDDDPINENWDIQ